MLRRLWRRWRKPKPRELTPVDTVALIRSRQWRTQLKKHFRAVFLLCVGAGISGTAVVAGFFAANTVSVSHALKLRGVVQAIETSTPVSHPIDGIVKSVLITEGEMVVEGQPLITLDASDLDSRKRDVSQKIARLLVEGLCVRGLRDNVEEIAVPEQLKTSIARMQQLEEMRRAIDACKTALQQQKLRNTHDQDQLAALEDQAALYRQLISADRDLRLSRRALDYDDGVENIQRVTEISSLIEAIDYALKLSETEQALSSLKVEIDARMLEEADAHRQRLNAISDALIEAEQTLAQMDDQLANRIIYASASGRIQRLRIHEEGRRVPAGAYVMEIAPVTSDFEVITTVHLSDMPYLELGQIVDIRFSGSSPMPITVPGTIAKISKVTANSRTVTIEMTREDLNRRDMLLGDMLLDGAGQQAEATVTIKAETAGAALKGILRPPSGEDLVL